MKKQEIAAIIAIAVAIAALVASVWISGQQQADPKPTSPAVSDTGSPSHSPSITPSPSPSADGGADIDHVDGGAMIDLSAQKKAAGDALTQYLTFDRNEADSARQARLAPLFTPDSRALTQIPDMVRQEDWDLEGFGVTVKVTSIDLVAFESANDDNTVYDFSVFASYTATYTLPGQTQLAPNRAEWHVFMASDGTLVQDIVTPQKIRSAPHTTGL